MSGSFDMLRFTFIAMLLACLVTSAVAADDAAPPASRAAAGSNIAVPVADVPLDQAKLDDKQIGEWVKSAAADVMTFDYANHETRFQSSSKHFTRVGRETFDAWLKRSRVLDAITAQSQTVTAEASGEPVIVQEGSLGGKYRWIIQMPLVVTYKTPDSKRLEKLQLNLVLERVSLADNADGVGIAQWITQ